MFYMTKSETHLFPYAIWHDLALDATFMSIKDSGLFSKEAINKKSFEVCETLALAAFKAMLFPQRVMNQSSMNAFKEIEAIFKTKRIDAEMAVYLLASDVQDGLREGFIITLKYYPGDIILPSFGRYRLDKDDSPETTVVYFNESIQNSVYSPVLGLSSATVACYVNKKILDK